MKKLVIATVVVAAFSSAASVFADSGKINFIGKITEDACTVVNDTTNPLTVTLGTVATKSFTGTGSTAAPTAFTLALTDCPTTFTSATVKFDGTPDSNNDQLLALTNETGVAKGVAIQLMDAKNVVVPLRTASSSYPLVEGSNNLDFVARYAATSDTVEAGSANSTTNFTIVYN